MIFKTHVKEVAETYLTNKLKSVPSALIYLLAPQRFDRFVELCWVRLNELDTAGYVKSRAAIDDWVMQAATAYGLKQLEKAGMPVPKES